MKLALEVISKEIIKPSSCTPDDLRRYQLSFLDQISPPVYSPMVLFYPTESEIKSKNMEKFNHLKQSLSEALNLYYPLAGRLRGNDFVCCNDEGVPCLLAQVKCKLSQVIENPVPIELNKLVPFELDDPKEFLLGVQFNIFECGGIAIGLCLSHKIGDASSIVNFIKSWSSITRADGETERPQLVSASLFPPVDVTGFSPITGITKENVVAKRFVFPTNSIEALRSKFATSPSLRNQQVPSRVETLSVFIWSRFMVATKAESRPGRIYYVLHAVNLRPRMDPPLPDKSFGNFYGVAITFPSTEVHEDYCGDLVSRVRDSINKVDKDHVKQLQKAGDDYLERIKQQAERITRGEMASLSFTSLCRFPLYDADFGCGKPLWVGSTSLTYSNLVVFMDTASGDGVEAFVHLKGEDMTKFQEDEELLQYVLPQSNAA